MCFNYDVKVCKIFNKNKFNLDTHSSTHIKNASIFQPASFFYFKSIFCLTMEQ